MVDHKHKGVERANGTLRSHPIERVHKDSEVQKWHNKAISGNSETTRKPVSKGTKKDSKAKPVSKSRQTTESNGKVKAEFNKLNADQVDKLKGKLVQVRRAGAGEIYVEVTAKDTVIKCLEKADVPTDDTELKIEGVLEGERKWKVVKQNELACKYEKFTVTTKVRGS